jgi:hypothetical protein
MLPRRGKVTARGGGICIWPYYTRAIFPLERNNMGTMNKKNGITITEVKEARTKKKKKRGSLEKKKRIMPNPHAHATHLL